MLAGASLFGSLYLINSLTGEATFQTSLGITIGSLDFASDGTLFGGKWLGASSTTAQNELVTIDPVSGSHVVLGNVGFVGGVVGLDATTVVGSPWTDEGNALAGTLGEPVLLGEGTPVLPTPGARVMLRLTGSRVYEKTGTVFLEYAVETPAT